VDVQTVRLSSPKKSHYQRKMKLDAISQERLNIEVKLLLSANRKSYMPR